jgi:[NiFe] hydrogenase small subunit
MALGESSKDAISVSGGNQVESEEKFDRELEEKIEELAARKGVTRRGFMKFCGLMAATLGLEATMVPKIARAIATAPRPPIVWLQFAECTGCTEALLRTANPFIDDLLLDKVSSEYHETLMAAAGDAATACLDNAVSQYAGQFLCFVEGAIPTSNGGIYGMIGGKTMLQVAQEVLPQAKKVICVGTCAAYGGLPAAAGGLTGAMGVQAATGISTINLPGCPPNAVNIAALIVNYLLNNQLPDTDRYGRPSFAYGEKIHSKCERRGTSWCLKGFGCKGPNAYHNCHLVKYNGGTSWCVQADAPCKNCTTPGFWDSMAPFFNYSGSY